MVRGAALYCLGLLSAMLFCGLGRSAPDARQLVVVVAGLVLGLVALALALLHLLRDRQLLAAEVEARAAAERELRESEARYSAVARSFPQGVLVLYDQNLRCLSLDGEGLPGVDFGNVEGREVEAVFGGLIGRRIARAARECLSGRVVEFDLAYWGRLVSVETHSLNGGGSSAAGIVVVRDMTESRMAQTALAENERRFATLIANFPGMVYRCVHNAQRTMEFVSQGCLDLTGWSAPDLTLNRRISWPELVHPDDAETLRAEISSAVEAGRPFVATYRIHTREGLERWVWERGVALRVEEGGFTALEGIVLDITERRRAEGRLREAYAELDQIFNSTSDGMYLMDSRHRYVRVNRTFCEMFSVHPGDLLGRYCDDLPPSAADVALLPCPSDQTMPMERSVRIECEFPAQDGGARVFENTFGPLIDSSGELAGHLVTVHEATDRVRAERAAKAREQQLLQADKLASLGTLVAGVAHEINNPNTVISLNVPMIQAVWKDARAELDRRLEHQGDFPLGGATYAALREQVEPLLSMVLESSRRIRSIVAELKDFARQERDAALVPVDLVEVVRAAARLVESKLRKSTERFSLLAPEGSVVVMGDFQRLEQVVVNLLINACEALTGADQAIEAAVAVAGGAGEVSVRDEGGGMSPEEQARALDPFYTTKLGSGGTGLGLAICHDIVARFGGALSCESAPGEGAVFRVRLPLAEADAAGTKKPGCKPGCKSVSGDVS
jgi:PAS domain S-box-containing protein